MSEAKKVGKARKQVSDDLVKLLHEMVAALYASDQAIVALKGGLKVENIDSILELNKQIFDFFDIEIIEDKKNEEKEDKKPS